VRRLFAAYPGLIDWVGLLQIVLFWAVGLPVANGVSDSLRLWGLQREPYFVILDRDAPPKCGGFVLFSVLSGVEIYREKLGHKLMLLQLNLYAGARAH